MATQYSPKIITDGLAMLIDPGNHKSYISGSYPIGLYINDLTENNNIGTSSNYVVATSLAPLSENGSLYFDANLYRYIRWPHSSTLSFSNALTIVSWVKFESLTTSGVARNVIIAKYDSGKNEYAMMAYGLTNSKLSLMLNTSVGGETIISGNTTLVVNTWYHFAATWNGSVVSLYINGKFDGSGNKSGTITSTTSDLNLVRAHLGGSLASSAMVGRVSMTSLYNRALSGGEIFENFNVSKTRFGL